MNKIETTDQKKLKHREYMRDYMKKYYRKRKELGLSNPKKHVSISLYPRLKNNGLPFKIFNDITLGIKMTRIEFAKKYGVSLDKIQKVLCGLRKQGYHVHPIGGNRGVGLSDGGILVNVTENIEDFIKANNNLNKYEVNPAIKRNFERLEQFLERNPDQKAFVFNEARKIMLLTAQKSQEVEHGNS